MGSAKGVLKISKIGCKLCSGYNTCANRINQYKVEQCGAYIDVNIPHDLDFIDERFVLEAIDQYMVKNIEHGHAFVKKGIEIIISDLVKQIPKKPIKIYPFSSDRESHEYACPNCKTYDNGALMYDSNPSDGYNYCLCCGQKLDWSEIGKNE